MYQIPGYQLISNGHHTTTKGGTNQLSDIWEKQFIDIYDPIDNTKPHITLGNVYRPPGNSLIELDTFLEEFHDTSWISTCEF